MAILFFFLQVYVILSRQNAVIDKIIWSKSQMGSFIRFFSCKSFMKNLNYGFEGSELFNYF